MSESEYTKQLPTGGPAFPTESERQSGATLYHFEGMTLLDYFAAHCPMQPNLYDVPAGQGDFLLLAKTDAVLRYQWAECMIAEKRRRESQ